jgi:TRAP-type C4-dicarboxylate transport system permease small subunit
VESEALMKLLLILLGIIMAQVSLIIAFHTSHLIVSVLLLFLSVMMIFGGLPKYDL